MNLELWNELLEYEQELSSFSMGLIKYNLTKHTQPPPKYLRKYQFTQMIKSGVNFEIANFIQGRASKNIGFNHYLAKKEIALKEYKKII